MRKYYPGLFAIALAIGFSAFTKTPSENKDARQTTYFWYALSPDKTATSGATVNSTAATKTAEITNYVSCHDDNNQPKCLVGFPNNNVMSGTSVTGISDAGRIILETAP
jgi:hypothetical protein